MVVLTNVAHLSDELHQTAVMPLLKYLPCLCFRIKPVLYTSGKSHARVSEERSYDGPSTSSAHLSRLCGPTHHPAPAAQTALAVAVGREDTLYGRRSPVSRTGCLPLVLKKQPGIQSTPEYQAQQL